MSEGNKKSGGNFKAQSAVTQARNKRLKGERHAKRMHKQAEKFSARVHAWDVAEGDAKCPVPRGTARAARRAHLSVLYTKRQAAAQAAALAG